ncbi:response regulator [Sphingoaurantiacus capsulatus]|uniref:histidine kinase n=1 Tax=Sphingoaurantiacus capsulatus TaxID=1771310 RepID=A0ABV7XGH4_9SPHN
MASTPETLRARDALPDPIEWPHLPGAQRRFAFTATAVILLGLASTVFVGLAMNGWEVMLIYGALVMTGSAVAYAVSLGKARGGSGRVDWTLVRSALDARTDALAITDGADRLVSANEAYGIKCGGYPAPLDLGPVGSPERAVLSTVAAQARRDGGAQAEIAITIDGVSRTLNVACRPADLGGEHLLWTIRRSAADKLHDETVGLIEGPFGAWMGAAGLMAVMTDRAGATLAANWSFRQALWPHGLPPIDLSETLVLVDGKPSRLRMPDGTTRPVRIIELPLQAAPDRPASAYLFLLVEEQAPGAGTMPDSVPALLGSLPLGLALADRDGRFNFMNAAFAETAGAGADSRVVYPTELVVDEDKAVVSDAVRRAAGGYRKPRDLRIRLRNRPEEQTILTVARAPGLGAAEVVLSLKDNREQMKLERQIAQATKMQAVGQLAGGVAHDFNNILTAVIGYCDLMLLRHSPGDSDFDDINQIRQNANRAANLVRQLLAFSRQQTLRPQIIQVSDVVGELSHLLKRLLGETVRLSVKHGRNIGLVRADPGQLEQVIVNLAVNARDAMPEGGELVISTYAVPPSEVKSLGHDMMPVAPYVAIAVKDTGTGIAPDIIAKIFEPFFTTKEFGKGTGLGLSTVYGIVKQTGGFIFADSPPGQGTSFTIYLPVHSEAPIVNEAPAVPEPAAPTADLWGKGTVLLVEDEGTVRAVAERALTRKGYQVLTAAHGEEALELLEKRGEPVDLLISDVVMPTMDGPTLVRHARERFPNLRIIFMSGYAEEQLRKSIDVPGAGFLPKPFSVQELGEAVRAAIARDAS